MSFNSNKSAIGRSPASVVEARDRFRSHLARRGLRYTAQRRLVTDATLRREGHYDADDLYEGLRAAGSEVSRATVYRTLGLLRDSGLIKEVLQCRGRASYEAVYGLEHHDHMLCVECGKVIEFRDDRIEELQRRICRRHGFRALEHRMGIRGICKQCAAAQKESGD